MPHVRRPIRYEEVATCLVMCSRLELFGRDLLQLVIQGGDLPDLLRNLLPSGFLYGIMLQWSNVNEKGQVPPHQVSIVRSVP